MRAAVLSEYGLPVAGEFEEPLAAEGQAIVEVACAGINPIDVLAASGRVPALSPALPSIAGREGVGLVDGRRVYFGGTVAPFGSLAERAPVERERLFDVPDGLADGLAVALGVAGLAGWLALQWRARLEPGEHVLVLGATGVVGTVAVQAARLLGAGRVVAAGRDPGSLERLTALGADATVTLDSDDANVLCDRIAGACEGRLDVIVDPVWGTPAVAALRAASAGGRLVQLGHSAAPVAELSPSFMRGALTSILGFSTAGVPMADRRSAYARMAEHAAAGEISVEIEGAPLADVEDAWARQACSPNAKLVIEL